VNVTVPAFTSSTHHIDQRIGALELRLGRFPAGVDHMLLNMPIEDSCQQSLERATGGRNGLEQCGAVTFDFQGPFGAWIWPRIRRTRLRSSTW
jgi:hypothetical protein